MVRTTDGEGDWVTRSTCKVRPDCVLALFKGQLASSWISDAVLVLDELPHSAGEKLNKVALRERYGDHLLTGQAA